MTPASCPSSSHSIYNTGARVKAEEEAKSENTDRRDRTLHLRSVWSCSKTGSYEVPSTGANVLRLMSSWKCENRSHDARAPKN